MKSLGAVSMCRGTFVALVCVAAVALVSCTGGPTKEQLQEELRTTKEQLKKANDQLEKVREFLVKGQEGSAESQAEFQEALEAARRKRAAPRIAFEVQCSDEAIRSTLENYLIERLNRIPGATVVRYDPVYTLKVLALNSKDRVQCAISAVWIEHFKPYYLNAPLDIYSDHQVLLYGDARLREACENIVATFEASNVAKWR